MTEDMTTIRPAGFQDVNAIFALIRSYPEFLLPRSMGDLIQNIDRCLVAEAPHEDARVSGELPCELLGTVSWQILPEIGASGNPAVEIKSLAVRGDLRGRGIGRRLVLEAVERIAVFHPREIIVLTFTPEFFERLGFEVTAKERLMHKLYMGCMNCTRYDSPFTCPEVAMTLSMDKDTDVLPAIRIMASRNAVGTPACRRPGAGREPDPPKNRKMVDSGNGGTTSVSSESRNEAKMRIAAVPRPEVT